MSLTEPPLILLVDHKPSWANIIWTTDDEFLIEARLSRAGGTYTRTFQMLVGLRSGAVEVQEQIGRLPEFCPERHINPGGSFCLGLGAGHLIQNAADASTWWEQLAVFLRCQETADEVRSWPPYAWISHGTEAGNSQIEAEAVASKLGLLHEYKEALQNNSGFVVSKLKLVKVNEGRLINGRAACVCGYKSKSGKRVARRKCFKDEKSPCLLVIESKRRLQEVEFWEGYKDRQDLCCSTMAKCPLRSKDGIVLYKRQALNFLRFPKPRKVKSGRLPP